MVIPRLCRISANLRACMMKERKIWRKDAQDAQEQREELADVGLLLSRRLGRRSSGDWGQCSLAWLSVGGSVDANSVTACGAGLLVTRDGRAGQAGGVGASLGCGATEAVAEGRGLVASALCRLVARARYRDSTRREAASVTAGG